jgi:hypothetical protein
VQTDAIPIVKWRLLMQLPYTIVFEPPSRSELRALLRMRGHWAAGLIVALTIGTIYWLANVARADAGVAVAVVPLELGSRPPGAAVWVDGRQRGETPLELSVSPGVHNVLLRHSEALDQQYSVQVGSDGAALDAALWRHQPVVTRLRPALPGAALSDVRLLETGQLALSIELPPGGELEGWRLDPVSGALESVLSDVAGRRLAFALDGQHLAYLGSEFGPLPASNAFSAASGEPPRVVWLVASESGRAVPTAGWRAPLEASEHLVDLSWSPDARRLLVVANQPLVGGASQSRGWILDADGQRAQPILDLPSQVVPGTAVWSPDGGHIAFVAHAGEVNALCLLGVDGSFRYVADLDPSSAPPLNYPALSWSADSQKMVFVAPHQHLPGVPFDWLTSDTQHALYLATLDQPTPIGLTDTRLNQVIWREDGQLLGLWRAAADSPLHIRLMDGSGALGSDLLELPLEPGTDYAAVWDLPRAELLVAGRNAAGTTDYWLARLGADASS